MLHDCLGHCLGTAQLGASVATQLESALRHLATCIDANSAACHAEQLHSWVARYLQCDLPQWTQLDSQKANSSRCICRDRPLCSTMYAAWHDVTVKDHAGWPASGLLQQNSAAMRPAINVAMLEKSCLANMQICRYPDLTQSVLCRRLQCSNACCPWRQPVTPHPS